MLNERERSDPEASGRGDTMTPKQVRFLKIAIAIMSALLVVGFILLLIGLFRKASLGLPPEKRSAVSTPLAAMVPQLNLPLKAGMQVANVLADQGRVIVHLRGAGSDEIMVIDLTNGGQQQRFTLAPPQ